MNRINESFNRLSKRLSDLAGTAWAFMSAVGSVAVWAITGPLFHFSETWQLVINTGTTIITFLMMFLVQNTQNRDNRALHLKMDELIRSNKEARNEVMELQDRKDSDIERIANQIHQDCANGTSQ